MTAPTPVDREIRDASTSDLDTCFFLEAGAGTGKTRILVDRVLEIVRRGVAEISQIVVITFTEKAAGELRARIRDRLHEQFEDSRGAGALPLSSGAARPGERPH